MQYVIETKRLCKTYGGRTVVHNLDLHVPQGCVYGFIGPNGAGKSTSMKMLLGLVHPTAGSVALLGRTLTERTRLEKILSEPPFSYQVYPSDANFLLVNVGKADAMYNGLVKKGIVVRNRSNVQKCRGCLRITIGTPKENDSLLNAMKNMKL